MKICFLLLSLLLFLLGPTPALYTCLIMQMACVLLVRDEAFMISSEDSNTTGNI